MIDVFIKPTHENYVKPSQTNPDDACYDVVAVSKQVTDKYIEYGLGFSTEFSPAWEGMIRPRSSVSKYDLIMCNSPATIEGTYRGEWKVRFKRTSSLPDYALKMYETGDRIAQITFRRKPNVTFHEVSVLSESARGEGGFGSTGA